MEAIHHSQTSKHNLNYLWICATVFGQFAMLHPIYRKIALLFGRYHFHIDDTGKYSLYVVPYLLLITLFLYRQQKRASLTDYFIILLTLFYFLPGNVLYVYGNWSNIYYAFHMLSYLSLSIANELIPNITSYPSNRYLSSAQHNIFFSLLVYIISFSVILITLYYNGFKLNLNLNDVYDLREEWISSGIPNIFNYYLPFAARITPILLLIALKHRNVVLSVLLIFAQLVSFSFGGMKYTLFALLLGILFHFFGQKIDSKKIILFFTLFVAICFIECILCKDKLPMFTIYTLRRTSFVPNQNGSFFFAFAQENNYLCYSESFLRGVLHYPYSQSFPHIIGGYAYDLPSMGANTGLFAEGFSQIGWFALPVYAILYIVTFRLYTICCGFFLRTDLLYIPLLGIVLYTSTFIDGAFFSVLLTQGGILTALTLYLLSKSNSRTINGK